MEPEQLIAELESLRQHRGWLHVKQLIAAEITRASDAIVIGKTLDEIAISAISRAATVQALAWVSDDSASGLVPHALTIERGKLQQ